MFENLNNAKLKEFTSEAHKELAAIDESKENIKGILEAAVEAFGLEKSEKPLFRKFFVTSYKQSLAEKQEEVEALEILESKIR